MIKLRKTTHCDDNVIILINQKSNYSISEKKNGSIKGKIERMIKIH